MPWTAKDIRVANKFAPTFCEQQVEILVFFQITALPGGNGSSLVFLDQRSSFFSIFLDFMLVFLYWYI